MLLFGRCCSRIGSRSLSRILVAGQSTDIGRYDFESDGSLPALHGLAAVLQLLVNAFPFFPVVVFQNSHPHL